MNELIPFPVPLSLEAHQQAQQACQRHFDLLKIKQVYLNTLAVCAVNFYVQCLGFETNLQDTYSSDPVARSLMDVADLQIKDYGTVECRPTSPNASYCYVPRETWSDRIGYIAVYLNEALDEAALLGFTEKVDAEMLPTSALQSIDYFPIFLHQTRKSTEVVQLSQWLEQIFETSWQAVESVLKSDISELAFRSGTTQAIARGKQLTLEQTDEPIVLALGLKPLTTSELDIWVEVCPVEPQVYLPENMHLAILDEAEETVMQTRARSTQKIQFQFRGEAGEVFHIRLAMGEYSVTETFLL